MSLLAGAVIHQREPASQLLSCRFRGGTVEGHQRIRKSGLTRDLRAPLRLRNRADLDLVGPAGDLFFVAMCHEV